MRPEAEARDVGRPARLAEHFPEALLEEFARRLGVIGGKAPARHEVGGGGLVAPCAGVVLRHEMAGRDDRRRQRRPVFRIERIFAPPEGTHVGNDRTLDGRFEGDAVFGDFAKAGVGVPLEELGMAPCVVADGVAALHELAENAGLHELRAAGANVERAFDAGAPHHRGLREMGGGGIVPAASEGQLRAAGQRRDGALRPRRLLGGGECRLERLAIGGKVGGGGGHFNAKCANWDAKGTKFGCRHLCHGCSVGVCVNGKLLPFRARSAVRKLPFRVKIMVY